MKTTRRIASRQIITPLLAVFALAVLTFNVHGQDPNYWTGDTSSAWNDPLNWTGDTFPTNTAIVNDVGSPATVSVNSAFIPFNLFVGDTTSGTLFITGGTLNVTNAVVVGRTGGSGIVNMSGGTFAKGEGSEFNMGQGAGATAIWNHTNGTITSAVTTRVGNLGGTATFNMYGGSLIASNFLSIGREASGELNLYSGTITKVASITTTVVVGGGGVGTGNGTLNMYGGTVDSSGATVQVAFGSGSPVGTVNLVGGTMLASNVSVDGGSGTINLGTNATLKVGSQIRQTGAAPNGVINFNGGKLIANGSSTAFLTGLTTANVLVGGAVIDTTNNSITISQNLLDGDGLGGGLTKLGTGTLLLNGTHTYTGPTLVNGGVLGGACAIPGSMTVATSCGLAPGSSTVGTMTVGALTLNGTTTNIYKFNSTTNDLIVVSGALTLGASTRFSLFGESTGLPYSAVGTFTLVQYGGTDPVLDATWTTASATNPHIVNPSYGFVYQFAASGGNLTLTITSTLNIGRWGVDSDGNWSLAGNWSGLAGTMPPRNASDSASFGTGTSLRTVTLDANETVGAITFDNPNSFVITGANTLTLDKGGNGAAINVTDGSANAIQSRLALNENSFLTVNTGKTLTISGTVTNSGGTRTLSISGGGTLGVSGTNGYGPAAGTVGTTLSGGGTLQLGSASALGAGDVTNSSSFTVQSAASNLTVSNRFGLGQTLSVGNNGNNNLTLAGVLSGGGALTKVGGNLLTLGATNTYSGATTVSEGTLNLAAGAAITNLPTLFVGSVSNVPGVMTNFGTIIINGTGSDARFNVGSGSDLLGTFNMAGGVLTENTAVRIGSEPASLFGINPGNGTFNMSGGTVTALSFWQVGRNFGVGTMNMTGGTFIKGSVNYFVVANSGANGLFNMSGGTIIATGQVLVAFANGVGGSVGVWNLSGSANVDIRGTSRFAIGLGGNGTLNQTGGTVTYTNTAAAEIGALSTFAGTGLWDMSGGTAVLTNRLFIGDGSGSVGTLNLSGSSAMSVGGIQLGVSSGTGTLNLNGGTLTVNGNITNGVGVGTFNFNGGTLRAGVSSATFMTNVTTANVNAGGAIIDSGANAITIAQPLLDGGGAFVKLGSGTLTLSGANTYSGSTTISNGTLVINGSVAGAVTVRPGTTLGGNGTVAGVVNVQPGASIGAGTSIGKLTLGSSPVLGGTVVAELNRNGGSFTNDLIDAGSNPLTYSGALVLTNVGAPLQVNDTFKLFNTSGGYSGSFTLISQTPGQTPTWDISNLTVNGTIRVASLSGSLPTTPTNIVFSTTGNQLSLSWPSSYTGWLLQSNSVSLVNTAAWVTVSGSSTTNQVLITIEPGKPNVFFRMRLP